MIDIICIKAKKIAIIWGIDGLVGSGVTALSSLLLPWGLAFAPGAMLYVISLSHEIIPEIHRNGHQNKATAGLSVGLVVMLLRDVWLG